MISTLVTLPSGATRSRARTVPVLMPCIAASRGKSGFTRDRIFGAPAIATFTGAALANVGAAEGGGEDGAAAATSATFTGSGAGAGAGGGAARTGASATAGAA